MVGFVDEQAEGRDASNPTGQADNGYLSILNGFQFGATKGSQYVYRYTVDPTDGAKSDIAANAPNNPLENALVAPPRPAGTIAYIGGGAMVMAGEDVGVRAMADLKFNAHMGGVGAGAGGLGASIGVTTIDRNVEAYIGGGATVGAGSGEVLVYSQFTDATGSTAWSGLAGAITLGAEVAVINDHSHVLAHVDNFANIIQAGDSLEVKAVSDRSVQATTVNGAVSAIASIGAAVSVANLGGETRAYLGAVDIGQDPNVAMTVENVQVTADSRASAVANAVSAQVGLGTFFANATSGAVAVANVDPVIQASIGGNARLDVENNITLEALSQGKTDTSAAGVAIAGGLGGGASVSVSNLKPDIRTYIGTGGVFEAGGTISLSALHNYDPLSGNPLEEMNARAYSTSVGGSLVGGAAGAVAVADASAKLETYVGVDTEITAIGGDVIVLSRAGNIAEAEGLGLQFSGLLAVGGSYSQAAVRGSSRAHFNGRVLDANNLGITAIADNLANSHSQAAAGGLFGIAVDASVARAFVEKSSEPGALETVAAYIGGGARVSVDNSVSLTSESLADAWAKADGVAVIAVPSFPAGAMGASISEAEAEPEVKTYIGSGAQVAAGGGISIRSLNNYGQDGNPTARFDADGNPATTEDQKGHADAQGFSCSVGHYP